MRRANAQLQSDRRTEILDAAERCFARSGFHQASMQDICADAGIHGVVSLRISNECDPWVKWPSAERSVKTMIDVLVAGLVREEAARA